MSPCALLLLLIIISQLCIIIPAKCNAFPIPKFPAILVFGDSTVDPGNNNYIVTPFKADHPPYGLDFAGGPTGRFSNGNLVPDLLASMMGLKETIPPFLDPNLSDEEIPTGVSFASAGSGYDELTTHYSNVIPVMEQLGYFKDYVRRLENMVNRTEAARILGNALVIISAGPNDFIFNFYDIPTRRSQFSLDEYQCFLQNKLQNFIKELYGLGCRKMLVAGLPPIGCLPIQLTAKSPIPRSCSLAENIGSANYNDKLVKVLGRVETDLPGSKIVYLDSYNPITDMISNPEKYGFAETSKGCCGTGLVEIGPLCSPFTPVCEKRSEHVFWDAIHPTESTYRILVQIIAQKLLPCFNE